MIAEPVQGRAGMRRASAYHRSLHARLERVNKIRREAFEADQISLWKRAVDAVARIERAIETNCDR